MALSPAPQTFFHTHVTFSCTGTVPYFIRHLLLVAALVAAANQEPDEKQEEEQQQECTYHRPSYDPRSVSSWREGMTH